jgi:hypothetical protein
MALFLSPHDHVIVTDKNVNSTGIKFKLNVIKYMTGYRKFVKMSQFLHN